MFHLLRRSPSSNMMHLRMLSVTAGVQMLSVTAGVLVLSLVSGSRCPDQLHCGDEQECCQSFGMIDAADADILYNTVCPDDSFCPWKFSCLRVSETYGCCPLAQGVACSDGKHCCPSDRECTADGTSCVRKTGADVPCDGTEACPDGSTCCKDGLGGWGCCPSPQAVCCEDFIHCCPEGTTCNRANQSCDDASGSVAWLKKVPSRAINGQKAPETNLSNVPCDDTVACPDGTTCCKDGKGGWGCCPFTQAVCCEDFIHCCPQGKTCNLAAQTCDDLSGSVPWLTKVPSRPIEGQSVPETKLSNVPCDDTVACPDGTTCCKDGKGGWGCCPFTQAVCCEDFIHCCPQGKKCNLAAQTCDDPSGSVPWLTKVPSRPINGQKVLNTNVSDVPCDGTVACPDGTTCCKDGKGGWGCCPFTQGVCCEDFIHCCPHGKKCNLAAMTCDDPSGSVPWRKKEPTRPIRKKNNPEESLVPCNQSVACPDGNTCCKNTQGGWSCCPFPQAVCCEDLMHCCPTGKKCNLATLSCDDPSESVPWMKKEAARPTAPPTQNASDGVMCDPQTQCPDHTTCCLMKKSQKWGCCPLDQATCCEDGENCCPKGYTCRDQWCVKNSRMKFESIGDTPSPQVQANRVCGEAFQCKNTETCCRISEKSWGCCPFPKAVCCSDTQSCCPAGYTCDKFGSCTPAMGFNWDVFFSKKKRAV